MKPKLTFLGICVVLALLLATLLPANSTLAVEPDRDTGQSNPDGEDSESITDQLWTSGWVDIATSQSLEFSHNMGGDIEDYAIQLWFRDTDAGGYGVNNRAYGGDEDNGVWLGAFWRSLDNTTISVARQPADVMADQVRVWIWPSEADLEYCTTGWSPIAPNTTVTVNHNLGGNVDDYVVKLWFRTTSLNGVHQIYYGNAEGGGHGYGAYWHGLDAAQVQVSRVIDDTEVEEFYLCVSVPDPPDWDSGWVDISPDETKTLTHNLGGAINGYVVRTEFKELPQDGGPEAPLGIHQFAYGGNASNVLGKDAEYLGANWQNLTNQSIDVYRWADDPHADQVRVRIWQRRISVYLPLVAKNHP
jgi:hypothetical protein